jgi:hypothetical protein
MKQRAVLAIRNLLTKNIYAPTLEDLQSDDALLENLQRVVAYINDDDVNSAVDRYNDSDAIFTAGSAFVKSSFEGSRRRVSLARRSSTSTTDVNRASRRSLALRRSTEFFRRSVEITPTPSSVPRADDPVSIVCAAAAKALGPQFPEAKLVAQIGEDVTMDAFSLPGGVTGNRPLAVTAMIILTKHKLIHTLRLDEHKMVRWLIAVEDG